MKKVIFIFAIILTALTSCEKEEIIVSETSKPQNKEILTFATQEEFEETLAKVNAMSKEERLAWEKEQSDTIKAHFLRNEHNKKTILTIRGKFKFYYVSSM